MAKQAALSSNHDMKTIICILAAALLLLTVADSRTDKKQKNVAVAGYPTTYFIDVLGPDLFFTVTVNNEERGKEIYQALYDRFTKEQGFDISITYEERIGGFVDTARWQ